MKIILLDIDDTLLDFNRCSYFALKNALNECGWIMNDSFFEKFTVLNNSLWKDFANGKIEKKKLLNSRWEILFKQENINVDFNGFDNLFQKYLNEQSVLMDGAKEIVKYLSSKYELYTASNGVAKGQINRLKKSGLYKYFKGMFISESIGYPKPKIEFFQYCFQSLNCDLEDIIIIGDSIEADMIGGINAGIKTCFVNIKDIHHSLKVDYEVHSLKEIKQIL